MWENLQYSKREIWLRSSIANVIILLLCVIGTVTLVFVNSVTSLSLVRAEGFFLNLLLWIAQYANYTAIRTGERLLLAASVALTWTWTWPVWLSRSAMAQPAAARGDCGGGHPASYPRCRRYAIAAPQTQPPCAGVLLP